MARAPARLSVRDATEEILRRQQQAALAGENRDDQLPYGGLLDRSLATALDLDSLIDVDWKTQRKRQQWERKERRDWPRTVDGRNYDGHHSTPKADGGGDGLDNFEPMDPIEHRKHHIENGDFRRWGARSRGKKGPKVKGLGWLEIIPNITGVLSGRIRTDSFDNFASDLVGYPSNEDVLRAFEEQQRMLNPEWKWGDPIGA